MCTVIGILISGGDNISNSTVEIFTEDDGGHPPGCTVPQLPKERQYHTQNAGILCGGGSRTEQGNCLHWSNFRWYTDHNTLNPGRYGHSSWTNPEGDVILMGGITSSKTTAKIKADGTSIDNHFALKYDTRYRYYIRDIYL